MERTNDSRIYTSPSSKLAVGENHQSKAEVRACKVSRHAFQQACDHLKRAERDLAETAAFMITSLTTTTAIQAVIAFVQEKLALSNEILRFAFLSYITIFLLIFVLGTLRISATIRRRSKAEREIDQTKKAIFEFCSPDQWPKPE
jgi:hypothetical protein